MNRLLGQTFGVASSRPTHTYGEVLAVKIEWNEDGFREMESTIQRIRDAVTVPTEGSEEEAIADVKRQLINKGIEPHDEGVAEYVRQARQG